MNASRRFSLLIVAAALICPLFASAATSEVRVLIDVDNNVATGCVVGGMTGVDQVLVTQVADSPTGASVTQTHRLVCSSGVLSGPTDIVTSGWPVGWQPTSGMMLVETRIPFSALGTSTMPSEMRIGFDGTRGSAAFSALTKANGSPILLPVTVNRRRAVGFPAEPRMIILDGLDPDWGMINPLTEGTAGGGASAIKLIKAFGFPNPLDSFVYFRFDLNLSGSSILAVDDSYTRDQGQGFTLAAPGVLANDQPNTLPLTAAQVSQPNDGSVTLNPDGSFVFTPYHPNSLTSDSFQYKAVAGSEQSNVATVRIKVARVCPNIIVTRPVVTTATVGTPFSQTFTQTGAAGGATFTTSSTLPAGLTLSTTGVLSGTPTQFGTFPIVVTVTDGNDCTGHSAPYNLVVSCQTITVTNPATNTGVANAAFSQTFTQVGAIGSATFTTSSALPAGLTLATNGTLSGTPTQTGTFPITVTVTDSNGCTGTSSYTLTITCQGITVTNPANASGTANAAFSEVFTQAAAIGTATFTTASTLPAGLTLATNGTLSGTPTQTGSFPIVVTVTDSNGCTGTSATYTLIIACQTINVTNPGATTGTVSAPFSQTFTQTGAIGTATFTTASTLPAGLTLATNGTLSGTPTQTGSFPIVVTVTDSNGCTGTGATYTLVIGCQTITVTIPGTTTGTVSTPFNQQFTQTGAVGGATFTTASTLPGGLTLATNGTLSGTPTQTGSFPIVVTVTDGNGCTGTSATYTLVIGCQVITVTNPAIATGPAGTPFSQTFTQTGAFGSATFTTASTLPTGLSLSTAGVLSGTPSQGGTFPIVVTVTDANGCTGTSATYNLVITCPVITVTNPVNANGTASSPFSETFTQTGAVGGATFSIASGTLPTGLSLSAAGVLSGTPTQTGSFPITVKVTDGNGCTGTGPTYTIVIACQVITVNNPANANGTASSPFSETFTHTGGIGTTTFTLASGTLPAGLTLATNGTLSGTPTQTGSFPITVTATDSNGCTGTGATYTIIIGCQTINVSNPGVTTGTVNAPFSQTFTQTGAIGTATFTTASTLPAGLTLATNGTLSGTPTQTGSFPIVVTVTDSNGCTGTGSTYTLIIGCQTITVTKPVNTSGTVSAGFSETFTQTGAFGTATFTIASGVLPTGLTLGTNGTLAGVPTQAGSFPITVLVTDSNGCTGTSATYNLVIGCQVITVGNPATTSSPAGTPLSINFTQSGAIGSATFTTASTLPTGLSLAANGTLSGTPTQGGSFPIVVTVTDSNGCTGTNPSYTLTITCPVITVTNPVVNSGTSGVAFSQTFTQTGGQGTITWSVSGTLPTGITLNPSSGVLSGTTTQAGTFPITITATDQNGCTGTGATYNLTINCQTITVTNPGVNTGTVDAAFSQTFTVTGILGTVTWSETGALPAGITLNPSTGVLSGTPTVTGAFPITVKATDTNGCFGTSSYTLTINCQTITVTSPVTNTGTVNAPFSQTFTQTAAHGTATFTTASTLPSGITLATNGTLSGTPTQTGSFPIVVTVTDSNGCTGTGSTYTLTIGCQTITVTKPVVTTGTTGVAFSQTFTQSGAFGTATFTTASTLPTGFTLSAAGVLSGTTNQHATFPITVTVTDSNGCTGTSTTYNLTINCQTISVTNPVNASGTVNAAFSEQFTQTGAIGGATFTTASTLPNGITLSASGLLAGTPTQSGSFPIVVTITDGNGCTGTGSTYTLIIGCNVVTVTNPVNNLGTAGSAFSETFTQTGGTGTITWSVTGTLPSGITLNTSSGVLSGVTSQVGTFPITVTATDQNGCAGTGTTYNLTIGCQTISITNPGTTSVQAGSPLTATFTATGILGTATWTETGTLPTGITLNSSSGLLSGTTTQLGSFPITVKVTDTNGCFTTSSYTLTVTCPVITVSRTGGGSFPTGTFNTAYTGQSVTATGGGGSYTFAVTSGALPTGLSLAPGGAISGTPTLTGVFNFTVTATDTVSLCTGSQAFSISIAPKATDDLTLYDSTSHIVDNTQFVITGGTTTSPTTPFVGSIANILTNDLPSGGVTATAGTFATTAGGSVTLAADGTFIYTPKANPGAAVTTSDSFTYTVVSNAVTSAPATVNLTLANRVWYVKNNGAGTNGQSQSPFTTLAAAQAASLAGDIIYVYNGDGTTTGHIAGITLKNTQQLIGEGVALVVNTVTLKVAGTKPQITNLTAASDAVTLADGNTVKGLTITGATRDGISSVVAHAGFTGDSLTVQNNTNVGVNLISMTGTVTITNSTITSVGNQALTINNGTAAVTVDNTNTIDGGTGTAVSVINRPVAAGAIAIGANLTNGRIQLLSNLSGTISFTGTQTLSTTTNTAVTMTTNAGATINFSGTLGITTSTGTGFIASGGGTLNVSGTANITSGAAAAGLSLNGITVGGTGVAFTSVSTTGATTGISLTNMTGTVSVNGGTITNGTTGVSLQGATTSLSLAGVTITGPVTGITNTTNFGTLTIGATVNVSAATALNLTTGAISGTFAGVTSTGGTNGVNLNAVTGSWGTAGGSLNGASGSTFNVTGGSGGTITWGAAIAQANAANVVTIASSNSNTINFNASVTSSGTSTGISISGSSGTYNFNGSGNSITGSGGGVSIANESGSVTFSSGTNINTTNTATASFNVTNSTASITYSGTVTQNANGGKLLNIATYGTGTLTMNGTSLSGSVAVGAAGVISTLSNITGTVVINNLSLTSSDNTFNSTLVAITGVNTGGSMTFNHLTLSATGSNHTGKGLTAVGGGTLTITATGGASSIDVGSSALDLNGQILGASAIGTLNSLGVATVNGVLLTNVTGGTLTIGGGTITGNTAAAFAVVGGSVSVTDSGNINQATASQPLLSVTGGHSGTLTFNTGTLSATNGTGLLFDNADGTYNFNGTTTLNGGDAGVDILAGADASNGSQGTFSFNANTAVTNPTGRLFDIEGSTPTFTYSGSFTRSTAGAGIFANGNKGGTITFDGNPATETKSLSTTTGNAIDLTTNTGATFNFTGGTLVLATTSGKGFNATGGGTVSITGTNNTIATTTGTALTVTSTNISSGGITLKSLNSNGAANGINLSTTGANGFLTITGTGTNNSGGTITGSTADGILLNSTRQISLTDMSVSSSTQSHIDATAVNGLTLTGVDFDTSVDHGILGSNITTFVVSNCTFNKGGFNQSGKHGIFMTNLKGSSSVTGSTFTQSGTIQFYVTNTTATVAQPGVSSDVLTLSGNTWNNHTGAFGGDHFSLLADAGSNMKLIVNGTNGENKVGGLLPLGSNEGGNALNVQATAAGKVDSSITALDATNVTAGVNISSTTGGINVFDVFSNKTANGTGFAATGSSALNLACINGTCTGKFRDNSINHTAGVGVNAISVVQEGTGTATVEVSSNVASGNFQRGISGQARLGTGTLNLTVLSNSLTQTNAGGLQVVNVEAGGSFLTPTDHANHICLNMGLNNATPAGSNDAYRLRNRGAASGCTACQFQLQNFAGNGALSGDVATWITTTKANTGTPITVSIDNAFSTSGGCPTPP